MQHENERESLGALCRRGAGRADRLSAAATGGQWSAAPDDVIAGWWVVRRSEQDKTTVAYAMTRDDAALMSAYGPDLSNVVGELLRAAGRDADMVDAANSRQPDHPGKTRVMHSPLTELASKVSAALLRETW